ncbi:hypothetical protein MRB53_023121 [Persea americana]|uniref:Uncharacterized protein n=1 Tax=Persea americana TaxID=3435 RepID=A0ACC2L918_PERAE|nr:hypothetical protein MRB53_023121 [Persea americana]
MAERERGLRFMSDLIHGAAGDAKKHEGKALEWLDKLDPPDLSDTLTPQQNTALHIAVSFQKEGLARKITKSCPPLLYKSNSKGDIPLHIAAKAGHLDLAKLLTMEAPGDLEERTSQRVPGAMLRKTNLEGNTPLHEALKMGHEEISLFLLDLVEGGELGGIVNCAEESPLYLAVAASLKPVVLKLLDRPDCSIKGPDGQTPLHIAVINGRSERGLEIVKILLSQFERGDIERVDRFGKTALHYAAALGRRTNLVELVKANPSLVYVADNDGNLPLHIIVKDGSQFQMAKDILSSNACAAEILDRKGRNALHVAAMNGNLPMLKFLLELPEIKVLINERDSDGNTPLHLAVKIHFNRMVTELLVHGASGRITNKNGLTPRDVNDFDEEFYYKRILIKTTLKSNGAVKSPLAWVKKMSLGRRGKKYLSSSDLRSLANTLSVVAALIATVTFAAAFTFPGGYKNNDPAEGHPVFIKRAALKAFVLSDTMAFCTSLTVAFLMVYTLAGDQAFLVGALSVSIVLLWVAVGGTVVALASALYVVLSDESLWLAIAVTCIGCSVPLLVLGALCFSWYHTPSSFKKLRDKM